MPHHPIVIDYKQARIIAGMLKAYADVLSIPPTTSYAIDALLDAEAEQALEIRHILLKKLNVVTPL